MAETAGATTASEECPRNVHEGDLFVRDAEDFDVDALSMLTEVTGDLYLVDIDVGSDLSFLSCLESVDEFGVGGAPSLRSLEGLERLASVRELAISRNPELTSLTGLSGIRELETLRVSNNSRLLDLGFPTLERAGRIEIGHCSTFEALGGPGLTDFRGLDGLQFVDVLQIDGNESLVSLEGLAARRDNGLVVDGIIARHNRALPTEHVQAVADLFVDEYGSRVCGNKGDERDWNVQEDSDCDCHPPE